MGVTVTMDRTVSCCHRPCLEFVDVPRLVVLIAVVVWWRGHVAECLVGMSVQDVW